MSLPGDLIDLWWDQAEEDGDEKILQLIDEIDRLKHEIGCRNRIVEQEKTSLLELRREMLAAERRRFRQGQAYIRDRVTLALHDQGMVAAASVANSQDGHDLPEDLRERLKELHTRMKKIQPALSEEWARQNKGL